MNKIININQSVTPTDWSVFYTDLVKEGNIPGVNNENISDTNAIFRGMALNLYEIINKIKASKKNPIITTIYTDVLIIPKNTELVLNAIGIIIYARRIEIEENSPSFLLDYTQSDNTQFAIFNLELTKPINISVKLNDKDKPEQISLTSDIIKSGIYIRKEKNVILKQNLDYTQGFAFQMNDDMKLYINNGFIIASLLTESHPIIAVSIINWVKRWAGASSIFDDLFFRSSSLETLLHSEIMAKANNAVFVPYLTSEIYTQQAKSFVKSAKEFESHYMQLQTQKVLTDENISTANTMLKNADSGYKYVEALLQIAENNYNNATQAFGVAKSNFKHQKTITELNAMSFKDIGIPLYREEQIIKAIFNIVTSVVTFGGAIAAMAVGDEAAAPAAAEEAVETVSAIAKAAETAEKTAELANNLADTMKKLKKLIEILQKVYELASSLKTASDNIESAGDQKKIIQKMKDLSTGADLNTATGWKVYKIQVDNSLEDPVKLGIEYASDYKESMDILIEYGQAMCTAQLAVISTGQKVAALNFRRAYAKQKKENLQKLINKLKVGEAPIESMMQDFYNLYLEQKSDLFTALKFYKDSYFYWALKESSINPHIVDNVEKLESGITDITKIAMDKSTALNTFDPPPQTMENIEISITDTTIISELTTFGKCSFIIPLSNHEFQELDRVRVATVRVWLEGMQFTGQDNSVFITISTSGNYLDRYKNKIYQFNTKNLTRSFKYMIKKEGLNPDWKFDNNSFGFIQIDGKVDAEVSYAYFQPTPFSEWNISVIDHYENIDYSKISKITICFEGTAIGETNQKKRKTN